MKRLLLACTLLNVIIITNAQAPAGYYTNTTGKSCASLKTTLKTIITTGHNPQTYNDLWAQYMISDVKPREVGSGSATVIWDIYSDRPGPANDPYNFTPGTGTGGQQDQGSGGGSEGQFYNREHSVPLSWFSGSTGTPGPATDYHHIFPTDKYVNGIRANNPYGKVATASITTQNGSKLGTSGTAGITGTVFEPADSFKGDVARAFLYFVTRYEDNMATWASNSEAAQSFEPNTFPSVDVPYLQLMLNWNDLDPVSIKEINRNNAAYTYQGNRNPYIDSPQYVHRVWNNTCAGLSALPVDIVLFTGKLSGDNVVLDWTTENEVNLARFEIERSVNGITYYKIGEVTSANAKHYTFRDNIGNNKGQRLYYRLRKVDKDGSAKYSAVFTLHIPTRQSFTLYPNPASSHISLQVNDNSNAEVEVMIADVMGRTVLQQTARLNNGLASLSTAGLSSGTYTIKITMNGESYVQKLVVRK